MIKPDILSRQIGAVRAVLTNEKSNCSLDDKLAGYTLFRQNVTTSCYQMATDLEGYLTAEARQWCEVNGLADEAQAWEKRRARQIDDDRKAPLLRRLAGLIEAEQE